MDTTHLQTLEARLSHEKTRLASATTESERSLRQVWIQQCEKEIAAEKLFLGIEPIALSLTDDELLAELSA
jgi:hypothetical protein